MSSCNSECSNENIYAYIQDFPVNIIALEMCDNTLDDYMINDDISDKEWCALLLQVIFTLLIYQKPSILHITIYIQIILCILKQTNNFYFIILIINITRFQHLEKYGKLLILEELFISIKIKLYVVIVLIKMVMLMGNIIVNLFKQLKTTFRTK